MQLLLNAFTSSQTPIAMFCVSYTTLW